MCFAACAEDRVSIDGADLGQASASHVRQARGCEDGLDVEVYMLNSGICSCRAAKQVHMACMREHADTASSALALMMVRGDVESEAFMVARNEDRRLQALAFTATDEFYHLNNTAIQRKREWEYLCGVRRALKTKVSIHLCAEFVDPEDDRDSTASSCTSSDEECDRCYEDPRN